MLNDEMIGFIKAICDDPAILAESGAKITPENLARIAQKKGYTIDPAEFVKAVAMIDEACKKITGETPVELSVAELGQVAGGVAPGPPANQLNGNMFGSMGNMADEIAKFANQHSLSEADLIKFNMAASRYNLISQLTSELVKELTDGEKAIAQKL